MRQPKQTLFLLLALVLLSCTRQGKTPEEAFTLFSLAAGLDQPVGLEKFGTKDYVHEMENRYDSLAMMSAVWPKKLTIVKTTRDNDIVTLTVQGVNPAGKTLQGSFKLRQDGEFWKVFEGDWDYLGQNEAQAGPSSSNTSAE